jgi:hypothetical protein
MYGKPSDGKSVLAEDLALHVAAGRPWHGRKVMQGAVVLIALERQKLVNRRAIAFHKKHGIADLPLAIVGGVHDFRKPAVVASICQTIKAVKAATGQPVVLVVIDTLSRALCGGDENSPKDMGAIVASGGRLQEATGAHVMWLHHVPLEAGDRMRGHGALLGAIDTAIHVLKRTDGVRTATVTKANDSDEGEQVAFTLESVEIGCDEQGKATAAPVAATVEGALQKLPPKPAKLPKGAQTALRALAEAIEERGEIAPTNNHVPANVRVTTVDVWREFAYARGISTGEPRAKQQAFKRAFEHLVAFQAVGTWDQHVWLARP